MKKKHVFDYFKVLLWPSIIFRNQNLRIWIDFIIILLSDKHLHEKIVEVVENYCDRDISGVLLHTDAKKVHLSAFD